MVGDYWIYSIYPAFAVLCCSFLIVKARRSKAALQYIKLFTNFWLINLFQVFIYLSLQVSFDVATYFTDMYLIAAYFLFAHLLQLALSMSAQNRGDWFDYIYIIPVALTVMHFLGLMTDGYRLEANTILHNDTEYAWCFDAFILVSSLASIITFFFNTRSTEYDYVLISRNIIALLSFVPFLLSVAYIVVRSNSSSPISVVYIVPTMSLWVVGVFYYITKPNIVDLTRSLRGHLEAFKLIYSAICHVDSKDQMDDFKKQWTLLHYKETIRKHRTYPKSAQALGVSESSLRKAVSVDELRKLVGGVG